jgi:hypothetical protein
MPVTGVLSRSTPEMPRLFFRIGVKDWLWDYDSEDVFTSSKRNKEFRLRRKFPYGTEEEFLSEALGNGDLSTIPKEYRRYLQLFREKISMAGQKTLLNKA